MWKAELYESQLEWKLLGEISTTWYADDTTLMAESEKELKILFMKVKRGSEKVVLKLTIQGLLTWDSGRKMGAYVLLWDHQNHNYLFNNH